MQLSPHFTRADLERSDFAHRNGIVNSIPDDQIETWRAGLIMILEPIAERFPDLWISSGFRCEDLNRKIGGSRNSQHQGLFWMGWHRPPKYIPCTAFDLELPRGSGGNGKLWEQIARTNLPFDQLIWEFGDNHEPAWIHISHVPNNMNRREALRTKRIRDNLGQTKVKYESIVLAPAPDKRLAEVISDTPPHHSGQTYTGGSERA